MYSSPVSLFKYCIVFFLYIIFATNQTYATGILQLTSENSSINWTVRIDDVLIEFQSGMEKELEAGSHTLSANAHGYASINLKFDITDGVVKIIEFRAIQSDIVETTEKELFTAKQKLSRLVVVGQPRNIQFSLGKIRSETPASFKVGVGENTIVCDNFSHSFTVPEDKVTYLKIDKSGNKVYGFNMTPEQESAIQASSTEEKFEEGYKLYKKEPDGISLYKKWLNYFNFMNYDYKVYLVLFVFILSFFLYLRFRLSLKGRAKARVRKLNKLLKQLEKTPLNDSKDLHEKLNKKLSKTKLRIEKFLKKLGRKIEKLETTLKKVEQGEPGDKKRRKLERKIKKAKIASLILIDSTQDNKTSQSLEKKGAE